jgi:hypothetical protein
VWVAGMGGGQYFRPQCPDLHRRSEVDAGCRVQPDVAVTTRNLCALEADSTAAFDNVDQDLAAAQAPWNQLQGATPPLLRGK